MVSDPVRRGAARGALIEGDFRRSR